MPRIIDDEIFQAVQERLKANQRGGKEGRMPNWYNFTGRVWLSGKFDGWYPLIFCVRDSCMGVCAAPVSGRWTLFCFCRMWLGLPIPGGHAGRLF